MSGRRVQRTTLIGFGCAAFLGGVGLALTGMGTSFFAVAVGCGLLVLCYRRRLIVAIPAVVICGLMVGLWRGADMQHQLQPYRRVVGERATVTGVVTQDSTYSSKGQIDFMMDHIVLDGWHVPGSAHVTSFSAVEPKQGDIVTVTAKAQSGFGSYQLGMYYAAVQMKGHGVSGLATLRRQFSAAVLNVLPEPQASLGLGFLLGIKSQLPQDLTAQLKIVGLTHIVVASGYNLTILVRAARRLLAKRSKYQATLAAVLLMIGFVGVTGVSASMARAALVTSLSLAAWYYGRVIHPLVLLLFSAAVTAAINPLYVWGDLGWYLSFLAFGGVMLGAPLLQKRLYGRRTAPLLGQIALETLCAELMTVPLTLLVFGKVSIVGLAANIIVAPLVPAAMLATFVGGIGAVVLPGIGSWFALPAEVILGYITGVIGWLASVPWAYQAISLSWAGLTCGYAAFVAIGYVLYRRMRYDYLSKSVVE